MMIMKKRLIHYMFFGLAMVLICSVLNSRVKMIPLYIGETKFTVEIADTHEKQLRGLMFRQSVPDDYGMLFVYDDEQIRAFWMKNTLVHLDLIFLDKNKQVVDMILNVPPCEADPCETYASEKKAQYVIELRGNRAEELNLKVGDTIFFLLNE